MGQGKVGVCMPRGSRDSGESFAATGWALGPGPSTSYASSSSDSRRPRPAPSHRNNQGRAENDRRPAPRPVERVRVERKGMHPIAGGLLLLVLGIGVGGTTIAIRKVRDSLPGNDAPPQADGSYVTFGNIAVEGQGQVQPPEVIPPPVETTTVAPQPQTEAAPTTTVAAASNPCPADPNQNPTVYCDPNNPDAWRVECTGELGTYTLTDQNVEGAGYEITQLANQTGEPWNQGAPPPNNPDDLLWQLVQGTRIQVDDTHYTLTVRLGCTGLAEY